MLFDIEPVIKVTVGHSGNLNDLQKNWSGYLKIAQVGISRSLDLG